MSYTFKSGPELLWFVATTVVGALSAAMALQGSTPPTDWKLWLLGVAAATVRPLFGGVISLVNRGKP